MTLRRSIHALGELWVLRGRLAGAMDQPLPSESADAFALSPLEGAGSFGTAAASPPEPRQRPSMADTLAATFGGGDAAMPGQVRQAYGKFKAFGL